MAMASSASPASRTSNPAISTAALVPIRTRNSSSTISTTDRLRALGCMRIDACAGQSKVPKVSGIRHSRQMPTQAQRIRSGSRRKILFERAQQLLIPPLDTRVTVAGDILESLGVDDGDAAAADLNETRILQGALDQIDGGALNA